MARQRGGWSIDTKSRLVKIIKTPVDSEDSLPPEMKQVLGARFFVETDDDAPIELDPNYGEEYKKEYIKKCTALAQSVAKLLKAMKADERPQPSKPTVYIADCSLDRRQARETVKSELDRLGYPILPDRAMPNDEAEYLETVQAMLARSALSIHMVGEHYGLV